jgi:uncharacterized protein YifN (PemK superfamily)
MGAACEYGWVPIDFTPDLGQILMCDFENDGFIRPEMQKVRHCVVVSPRYRRHTGCCLLVPLSTVAPDIIEPYHYRIPCGTYSCLSAASDSWAKGDMLTHAAFSRLDRPLENGRHSRIILRAEDLVAVRKAALCAIGFPDLAQHL